MIHFLLLFSACCLLFSSVAHACFVGVCPILRSLCQQPTAGALPISSIFLCAAYSPRVCSCPLPLHQLLALCCLQYLLISLAQARVLERRFFCSPSVLALLLPVRRMMYLPRHPLSSYLFCRRISGRRLSGTCNSKSLTLFLLHLPGALAAHFLHFTLFCQQHLLLLRLVSATRSHSTLLPAPPPLVRNVSLHRNLPMAVRLSRLQSCVLEAQAMLVLIKRIPLCL